MSIHVNVNIPGTDIERLWGAASTKVKQAKTKEERAYWFGVMQTFEIVSRMDPPGHTAFISELSGYFLALQEGDDE